MSDMGDALSERKSPGCGLFGAVFGRKNNWLRRSTSTGSIRSTNSSNLKRNPSIPDLKQNLGGSFKDAPNGSPRDRIIERPGKNHVRSLHASKQHQQICPTNYQNSQGGRGAQHAQGYVQGKKLPYGTTGISGELESMFEEQQRSKGFGKMVRASSGNVMLHGNLGNLGQPGATITTQTTNKGHQPTSNNGNYNNEAVKPASLCRALSTRMDPEELKILGNEDYKNGNFEGAVALYDAAIAIDPNKASYRSNKSAALTALGKLLDAVFECREAIKIDPLYQRAHNRLSILNLSFKASQDTISIYDDNNDNASDVVVVSNIKSFKDHTNSHKISVVLFSNKQDDKSITLFVEQLSSRYPSIKFLKVEVDDCPDLEESEGVDSLPSFKLYKNGLKTKDISGNDHDLLESAIKIYTS